MKIRQGKDIILRWKITTNGEALPLEGRNLTLILSTPNGRERVLSYTTEGDIISTRLFGKEITHLGDYTLTLWENRGEQGQTAVDAVNAFELVKYTTMEEDGSPCGNLEAEVLNLSGELGVFQQGTTTEKNEQVDMNTEDIAELQQDMKDVQGDVAALENADASLREEIGNLKDKDAEQDKEMENVKAGLEQAFGEVAQALEGKQPLLTGNEFKTINGESILGSGNIKIEAGITEEEKAEINAKIEGKAGIADVEELAQELATKAPKVGYAPDLKVNFAKELVGRGEATPEVIGGIRPTGEISIGDGNATIERIKGESVVWNQLVDDAITFTGTTTQDNITYTPIISTGSGNIYRVLGVAKGSHKYLCTGTITNSFGNVPMAGKVPLGTVFSYENGKNIYLTPISGNVAVSTDDWVRIDEPIQFHDLTLMFGSGNEPTTIEEFEARKPLNVTNEYNEGTIVSYDGDALKSVGFNAYNGTYAKVIGGEEYHATGTTSISFAKELGADTTAIALDSEGKFIPEEDGYVYAEGKDIVIHLTHSYTPEHVDEYEEDVHPLPDVKSILDANGNQLFPYGLLSAGSVHDEITATKAIKRVGVVDMGTLSWKYGKNSYWEHELHYAQVATAMPKSDFQSILVRYTKVENVIEITDKQYASGAANNYIYVYDSSYTSASDFKQAMSGVLLYYELATPIEVDLPEPLNMTYEAWDFGTEELVADGATTPLNADIVYQFNAVDRIRENSSAIDALEEHVEEHKDDGIKLLDNGNLELTLKGETREFMPATPSGDPMHWAYVSAGAEYNDTGEDKVKDAPWKKYVDTEEEKTVLHKAGHWYLNGLGDITNGEMRVIYAESQFNSYPSENVFVNKRTRTLIDKSTAYPGLSRRSYQYYNNTNIIVISFNYSNVEMIKGTFESCSKLKHISTNLNVQWVSTFDGAFSNCKSLVSVVLSNVRQNISFASSQFISKSSVKYMIEKATPSSAITITLHHDAYERLKEDADILQALTTKNADLATKGDGKVSLVCATDNDTIPTA